MDRNGEIEKNEEADPYLFGVLARVRKRLITKGLRDMSKNGCEVQLRV